MAIVSKARARADSGGRLANGVSRHNAIVAFGRVFLAWLSVDWRILGCRVGVLLPRRSAQKEVIRIPWGRIGVKVLCRLEGKKEKNRLFILCPVCSDRVPFFAWSKHFRSHGNKCPLCGREFGSYAGLLIHLRGGGDFRHKALWALSATKQGKAKATREEIGKLRIEAMAITAFCSVG